MDQKIRSLLLEELTTIVVLEKRLLKEVEHHTDPMVKQSFSEHERYVKKIENELARYEKFLKPGHFDL